MKRILCLGDSLTFGARDEFYRSYPAELSKLFWVKDSLKVSCINRGVSGETSSELLKRAFDDVSRSGDVDVALLLIGSNDTFVSMPLEVYEDNLRQILLCLSDVPRVGIGLLPPITGLGLLSYPKDANEQVKRFNSVILNSCYIFENTDFIADFTGMGKYIIDTVHFNNKGYKKMAEIWYDCLKNDGFVDC